MSWWPLPEKSYNQVDSATTPRSDNKKEYLGIKLQHVYVIVWEEVLEICHKLNENVDTGGVHVGANEIELLELNGGGPIKTNDNRPGLLMLGLA